jgi:hypothetical protein
VKIAFDLSGTTSLALVRCDERVARYVRAQMDPYSPSDAALDGQGVLLEARDAGTVSNIVELQNPAGDATITASDGGRLAVVSDGRSCTIPAPGDEPARFEYDPGFPVWRLFGDAVRPALQISMLARESVSVHSASVDAGGGAILVSGWSESGKTETALALTERGSRFLSDKWTVLGPDGTAAPFPIGVGIRRWVLRYLPKLKAALPAKSRAQFAAAGTAAFLAKPLLDRPARGRLSALGQEVAERAIALADRAGLTPADVRSIYGVEGDPTRPVPLRAVAVLVNVPGSEVRCDVADPEWAARRLARSAAFERRGYFALQERRGFAFEREPAASAETTIAREEELLRRYLSATRVLRIEAPFPTDPRPVAAAIEAQL